MAWRGILMRAVSKGKPSPDQLPLFTPMSDWQIPKELPDLSRETEIAIDIETRDPLLAKNMGPGFYQYERTNPNTGYICGISAAWRDQCIYIPLKHPETRCFDMDTVRRWLISVAAQDSTRFIFHNFQYDWGWIGTVFNIPPPLLLDDTAAMASMVEEDPYRMIDGIPCRYTFSLDDLCKLYKISGKDEQLIKEAGVAYSSEGKENLWRLPGRYVGPYAEQDATSTLNLARTLRPLLSAEHLDGAYQIERDLMPITLKMKWRGIRVDTIKARQIAKELEDEADRGLKFLTEKYGDGKPIGIDDLRSSKWLKEKFDAHGFEYGETAKKNPRFDKVIMARHAQEFPRVVQKIKHLKDLSEKFLINFICGYEHKGRVYPTLNQFKSEMGGTRSHRFSYSDPPLQQMPSRDNEYASLIRSCFIPEDGEEWCSIDYRQQEYRLIVYVAERLRCKGARLAGNKYRTDPDTDFHDYVSALTKLPRKQAKDINFATSYGAGVKKFAAMAGMDENEARAALDQYNERLPFVKEAYYAYIQMAEKDGFIELIDGARGHFNLYEPMGIGKQDMSTRNDTKACPLEEANRRKKDENHPWHNYPLKRAFTHKAFNRMIQGSAARQIKKAMVDTYNAGYLPILQVHDELCFSLSDPSHAKVCAEIMEQAVPSITIPMLTDIKIGKSWGDLKK